jgi:hypothetical protein
VCGLRFTVTDRSGPVDPEPAPVVGGTYQLGDADYRYGVGPLLITVTAIVTLADFGAEGRCERWWHVAAIVKPPDYPGPGQERELYVRPGCLAAALRPPYPVL